MGANFSSETLQAKRDWYSIFKTLKEKIAVLKCFTQRKYQINKNRKFMPEDLR